MNQNEAYYEIIAENIKTATQVLFKENSLEGLAVRIESEIDEIFWRPLLETALPNKAFQFFPTFIEASTTQGKDDIFKYIGFGDKQLIFCIDSDYEYLLENPILQTPFVFHTYIDAIENYWCYAEGLSEILKKATNTEGVAFDFTHFFEAYSEIIYPYLLCSLFSTKEGDGHLSRNELGRNLGWIKMSDAVSDLTILRQRLHTQYNLVLNQYTLNPLFESFKQRMMDLDLRQQEAYLFGRGHDILDRVLIPLMQFLGDNLVKTRFASLTTNAEKADYHNHIKTHIYSVVAQNNTKIPLCSFYQRIVQDIQIAFTTTPSSTSPASAAK